jgi:alkyl hydroperoxide reductase subunit AhpC
MNYLRYVKKAVTGCMLFLGSLGATAYVGDEAPNFSTQDIFGNEITLNKYRGHIVVLEWTNPRCPFVRKQYSKDTNDGVGNMQAMQKQYTQPSVGVIWLTIASSSENRPGYLTPDEWKTKLSELGASPTALIIDSSKQIARLFGARCTPHVFVIGKDGTLLYQGAVDSLRGTDPSELNRDDNLQWFKNALEHALQDKRVIPQETIPYGCPIK